jgi:hypothetical protein
MSQRFFPDATVNSGPVAPPAEGGTSADAEYAEGLLAGAGGAEIYWQAWVPSGEPRAVVVIVHGIGETPALNVWILLVEEAVLPGVHEGLRGPVPSGWERVFRTR